MSALVSFEFFDDEQINYVTSLTIYRQLFRESNICGAYYEGTQSITDFSVTTNCKHNDQRYVQLVRLLAIYKQECELIDCLHAACGPDCDAVAMAMRPRRSTDTSTSRTIAAVVMDIYDAEGSLV